MTTLAQRYLQAARDTRWAVGTFMGRTFPGLWGEAYDMTRNLLERELTLMVKAGAVVAVRSVGNRVAYLRRLDVTPADVVLHAHPYGGTTPR